MMLLNLIVILLELVAWIVMALFFMWAEKWVGKPVAELAMLLLCVAVLVVAYLVFTDPQLKARLWFNERIGEAPILWIVFPAFLAAVMLLAAIFW